MAVEVQLDSPNGPNEKPPVGYTQGQCIETSPVGPCLLVLISVSYKKT
jgi:hypothetical protein